MNEKFLLPVGSLFEFLGILTLLTNEGMLVPKVDFGFSVPALISADIQGMGLLLAGAGITGYAIMNMR